MILHLRKLAGWLLAACFMAALLLVGALAVNQIDTTAKASLQVALPAANMEVRIYQVADMDASGKLTLRRDFADYPVSMELTDASDFGVLAETLSAYAARDQRTPLATSTSDDAHGASFQDLAVGLYLVIPDKYVADGKAYAAKPMLIALPGQMDGPSPSYDVSATAKYAEETVTTLRVHKTWVDSANPRKRPSSVQVELLRDGKVDDTVTLNAKNSWSHEWTDLDAASTWQIVEKKVPTGYTVQVSLEGTTYLLTNTLTPVQPSTSPSPSVTPTPGSKLPNTGMLWWPVPVLAALGLLSLLVGALIRRRTDRP